MPSDAHAPARPSTLARLLSIDVRSLAAFRIGLGLLLLLDLAGRARTLRADYTGEGAYPRELALALVPEDIPLFHVFLLSDRVEVQAALFGVLALLAVLLALGWRTRLVSALAFVMLVSLVRRNHWACHTGDVWLETLLLWAVFLPLGAGASLDRMRGRAPPVQGRSVLSLATAGALLQVAVFYLAAGWLKARYDVWTRGEAVWVFTHVIEYTRPFGAWLGRFPAACSALTWATLVMEGLAPLLLFLPWRTALVRGVLFVVFAGFHLTLQATIHIGIFQLTCIVALTLFLPGEAWDALARRLPALRAPATTPAAREAAARGGLARATARATSALLALALLVILASNVNTAVRDPYERADRGPLPLPRWLDTYGRELCLVQNWNMFTDIERAFFGWFLVLGQQEDGAHVDVLERRPAEAPRAPEDYARSFPNHNSRRYWREMARPDREDLQKAMCDYLAREWLREGRAPLTHLAIYHVGRIPSRRAERDEVKPIVTRWEAPHEPLASAPAEVQELWRARRERWRRFLESVPATLPSD